MRRDKEIIAIVNRAELFCNEVKGLINRIRDLAIEIEGILELFPEISITKKHKCVKRNKKEYYYDYIEITVGNRVIYLPVSDEKRIRVLEKAARLRRNLHRILEFIYKL